MTDSEQWKILELAERYLAGALSPEEAHALDAQLKSDAAARRVFAAALHQHAELKFDRHLLREPEQTSTGNPTSRSWQRYVATAAAAACITLLSAWLIIRPAGDAKPVATLVKARDCQWSGSSLPTMEGARLSPGLLDLKEGMATLKFDSGAELVLEAPATLEVLDGMNCRLRRGTLVADVPPSAKGFTVDTTKAQVVDWGTRFGVSASEDGKYLVQVLEGRVDVTEKPGTSTKELRKGDRVDKGWSQSRLAAPESPADADEPSRWLPDAIIDGGDGWSIISTTFGQGRDSYIQSTAKAKDFGSDAYVRVKRSDAQADLNRKAYLAFDLGKLAHRRIAEAELVLTVEPSDLGFASFVPDSTFAVYGLINESADNWDEHKLSWTDAPAHDGKTLTPLPADSRLLGRFVLAQGVNRGTCSIKGTDLVSFLNTDTNGLVTLIIVRETDETHKGGLVHAFATKENTRRSPPLLRVRES